MEVTLPIIVTPMENELLYIIDADDSLPRKKPKKSKLPTISPPFQTYEVVTVPEESEDNSLTINYDSLCRICANETDEPIRILDLKGQPTALSEKIHLYLPIKIRKDDGLPKSMCPACMSKLEQSHAQALMSQKAEALLMEYRSRLMQQQKNDPLLEQQDQTEDSPEMSEETSQPDEQRTLPFPCDFCPELMKTPKMSRRHYQTKHKQHLCPYCFIIYKSAPALMGHIEHSHTATCIKCDQKYDGPKSVERLNVHYALKHPELCGSNNNKTILDCKICSKRFKNKIVAKSHYINVHEKYMCCICLGYFNDYVSFNEHVITENHNTTCEECNKDFNTRGDFIKHKENHNRVDWFVCVICAKNASTMGFLKRHYMEQHSKFCCVKCKDIFDSVNEIDEHSLRIHKHKSGWRFKCETCLKHYDDLKQLKYHIRLQHFKGKGVECKQCGKMFFSKKRLVEHKKTEHAKSKFCCEICSKEFNNQLLFLFHQKNHSEHDSSCPFCNLNFIDINSLNEHLKEYHLEVNSNLEIQ